MAMDTSGFVPRGNLNADDAALADRGRRATVKRVAFFLKGYSGRILITLFLAAVSVVFTLLVPIKIGNAIDCLLTDNDGVINNLLIAAVYAVIVGVSQYVMNVINNSITYNTVRDVRNAAIEKIEHLPLRIIDSSSQGDIVSRIVAD
ncbi:MAG: hypothetical protein IJ526_01075, partial [Lachnospiraceae bacterium]|nr:hypothetical protein [Lachnospiraceae bacterium]